MKTIILLLLSLLSINSLTAQEGGTDCSSAVSITINGSCISNASVSDNTATNPALSSCTGTFSREEWYKFTVSAGPQNITITGITTGGNLLIQIISQTGLCTGLAEIGCANADAGNGTGQTETVNLTSLTNGTYYIKVVNIGTGGGSAGNMALSSLCVTAPAAGDNCSLAIPVTINGACTSGTITDASIDTDFPTGGSCTYTPKREGFYTFTVTSGPQNITISATVPAGVNNLFLHLYKVVGSCGGGDDVLIDCEDSQQFDGAQTETMTNSLANGVYILRIVNNAGSGGNMPFSSLCLTIVNAPANDDCSGAITVSCNNSYSSSTANATIGSDPTGNCGTTPGAPGVWYKFVGNGQIITASLCGGASWDTKINVYSGTCAALACIGGNDDGCSSQSTITFTSSVGTDYYILVNGYSGATGAFTLNVTCCTPGAPSCATAPSPANSSTAIAICNTSLSWSAPASTGCNGATSYDVYFGTSSTPPFVINITSTTYTLPTLSNGTIYYWQIRPKNGTGTASGCSTWSFTTANSTNPNYAVIDDAVATGSCTALTSAANDQRGCVWDINSTLNFLAAFTYDFKVNLGSSDAGADGMAFVMQNDSRGRCACGSSGGSLGAGGITNSLIVEIDTYLNYEDRDDGAQMTSAGVLCSAGTDPDHLDIWLNGVVNPAGTCPSPAGARIIPSAAPTLSAGVNYNIENGLDHILRVIWAPGSPGTLTAQLLNTALTYTFATVSYAFNPMTVFGTNTPYFGFTASTGGLSNQQTFCNDILLLPIELISFTANCNNNNVIINWSTASETNNKHFELERSNDGVNYNTISIINGHGNTTSQQFYTYTDYNPQNIRYHYRLKQVDFNGKFSYHNSIVTNDNLCSGASADIILMPNPANDLLMVKFGNDNPVKIEIINDCGQLVYVSESVNKNQIEITTSNFAAGIYAVRVIDSYKTIVKKVTITH